MKKQSPKLNPQQPDNRIVRQLELITRLLTIIATDKDFPSDTPGHQIAILGKLGFRNIELADLFGITPQQANNALRKYKGKKRL